MPRHGRRSGPERTGRQDRARRHDHSERPQRTAGANLQSPGASAASPTPTLTSRLEDLPPGLYLVPTPLGNLADLSPRAARVLAAADCIACEDTRRTGLLLHLTGLPKRPLVVVEAHREAGAVEGLLERLRAGGRVALVSDGGTPCLSDPGRKLVEAAAGAGVNVISLPGPSAVTAAFAASGFAAPFTFHGFLARKGRDRARVLAVIAARPEETAILFESPFRLSALLKELAEDVRWSERPLVLAQEISKIHETWHRGSAAELLTRLQARGAIKGEWTVLIGPVPRAGGASVAEDADEAGEPGWAGSAAPDGTVG